MTPSLEIDSTEDNLARDAPGFYLIDDAHGRFVVDPAFGFISLRDEATLESERGQVFVARLRVVEPSGEEYTLDMRLKITGRVPQMLGPEEDALPDPRAEAAPMRAPLTPAAWTCFSAWRGEALAEPMADEDAAFGVLIAPPPQIRALDRATLTLAETPPPPAPRAASWAL
jgi:hypothetical protein